MAYPYFVTWPTPNTVAICPSQTLAAAGNLKINGVLSYSPIMAGNTPNFNYGNISRTVSITSTGNQSALSLTVTGTYLNMPQTETITGPNNDTVYGNNYFDEITSVYLNGATNGAPISVGTGTTGHTRWYAYNCNATVARMSIQVDVTTATSIVYGFQTTLDDVYSNLSPYITEGVVIPAPSNSEPYALHLSNADTSDFGWIEYPVRYARVLIHGTSSIGPGEGNLTACFIQQGIT